MTTDFYVFLVKVIPFTIESYFEVYQKQTQLEGFQMISVPSTHYKGKPLKIFLLIEI